MPLQLLKKKSVVMMTGSTVQEEILKPSCLPEKHDSVLIADLSEVVTESNGRIDEIVSTLVICRHQLGRTDTI
jgi:hypothetical protein